MYGLASGSKLDSAAVRLLHDVLDGLAATGNSTATDAERCSWPTNCSPKLTNERWSQKRRVEGRTALNTVTLEIFSDYV
jgi:hypothetical protein